MLNLVKKPTMKVEFDNYLGIQQGVPSREKRRAKEKETPREKKNTSQVPSFPLVSLRLRISKD